MLSCLLLVLPEEDGGEVQRAGEFTGRLCSDVDGTCAQFSLFFVLKRLVVHYFYVDDG